MAVQIIQMIFRVAGLGDFSLRHLQRGGEIGFIAAKQRDRRDAARRVA
jgi:hypothetical protein